MTRLLGRSAVLGSAALAALVAGLAYAGYAAERARAYQRVATGSAMAQTPCGPIEYAAQGAGPAVLVVHGAGGGFDQGRDFGAGLAQAGFRVVAMSRFGYLRTPLPPLATPAAQADAHACLLDALGLERAAIVGLSAGAPSALEFALRHPARTAALVLVVPLAHVPGRPPGEPPSAAASFVFDHVLGSDFLYWLALHLAPGTLTRTVLGTPPEVAAAASASEAQRIARALQHLLPLAPRRAGLENEARIARTLGPLPLERIAAPTLVISAADDLYGTSESAGHVAAHIRGARFVGYRSGGHLLVGHQEDALAEIGAFLAGRHRPLTARVPPPRRPA